MKKRHALKVVALAVLMPLAACSDLLDVESPGRIADDDLGTKDAISGMVVGMKYDLSQAVDGTQEFLALAAIDLPNDTGIVEQVMKTVKSAVATL